MTEQLRMQRSSRDPEQTRQRLQAWLADRLGPQAHPEVSNLMGTDANGMSSDTVLFDAAWDDEGHRREERLVARVAPDLGDVPVFPTYDLRAQFDVITAVSELTDVPVPRPWWCEGRPEPLGAPFFVMSRVDGEVPPDVMPYTFGDNWLIDAAPDQQRRLQVATVEAIAALHEIDRAAERFPFLQRATPGDTPLRRHVANTRDWYAMVAREGAPSALVENAFDWLDAHWPAGEGPTVLAWGDARIGNVLYADFAPAALLDWEMAGLGPRELDVGWLVYAHLVFQDLATGLGVPGMPDFLRPADVIEQYESLTGHRCRDLRWFMVYSAIQWGTVFLRTGQRAAHFAERDMPADPQELLHNRPHLESLLCDLEGI